MSEHRAKVSWRREGSDFAYETYDRTHQIIFEGGINLKASSAPEFLGKKELANPEEMLAGALASCHMLTFLAVAAKSRLNVESYQDHAVATLEKGADGKMSVTKITLSPVVRFTGEVPDAAKVKSLHEKAHSHCFIANSVKSKVEFNLD